jgi:putative peptidoglycan lipid II flippase
MEIFRAVRYTTSMAPKLWNYLFGSLFRRGATILTVLTLGSYVLGLVRDMLFARFFGASRILDIYNAAFIVPDILLNVFIAGALTAAFVPVFTHLLAKDEDVEAHKVASTMMVAAPLAMAVIGVVAFIFMPTLARLVAPGFTSEELGTLIHMSRLLLLSPLLFALSNTFGNILVSYERFVGYGIAPILYNLGIISGVFLVPLFGPTGLILGTLSGAILHLAVRAFSVLKSPLTFQGPISFSNPHFRQILKLMLPRMAGQPIEQLTFFIFTNMASTLAAGSIAVLSFARNFESVPVSIFGISFATAVFSSLSRKAALGDRVGFMYHLRQTGVALAITSLCSMAFYVLFGHIVIRIFLGGGRFDATAIQQTGTLLAFFALAIPAESIIQLLVRAFYAIKDTWTPILISVPGLGLIALLAKLLMPRFGLNGLAVSFALASSLEAILLFVLLRRKLRNLHA